MLIWCDFIEEFILEDNGSCALGMFGFIDSEYDNLGFVYVGY